MSQAFTTDRRTMHLWSIGAMAEYMMYVSFGFLVQPIFTLGFGVNPKLVGWALALPRLLDAFLDPILGHWSDITHTRWGRRRPFIFGTTIAGSLIVMGMWWPSRAWSETALFAWMLVMSVAVFGCYGLFSMTHLALGYELSDDYSERARVLAIRGFYWSIAALGGSYLYWLTLRPVFENEVQGIRWVSLGMGILVLVCGLVPALACRERFQKANRQHVNLWHALRATLSVRPFIVVLLLRVTQSLGTTLYQLVGLYILIYSVCGGDKGAATALSIPQGWVGFAWGIAMMYLAAPICHRLGKRRGIILGYGASLLFAVALPFFTRPGLPWLYLCLILPFVPFLSVRETMMASVMPDICDLDELRSGERREALFTAVLAFVNKCENSMISLAAGYFLAFIGFDGKLAHQPPEVVASMRFWGFGILIVFSAVAFALSWLMPITPRMMEHVRAQLDARRRKAAEEPVGAPAPVRP